MIDRLVNKGPLSSLTIQSLHACESCLVEKMTKMSFIVKDNRSKGVIELVYTDMCGTLCIRARRSLLVLYSYMSKYLIIIWNDNSFYHTLDVVLSYS